MMFRLAPIWIALASALPFCVAASGQNLVQSSGFDEGFDRWLLIEEFGASASSLTSGTLTRVSCSGSPCSIGGTLTAHWFTGLTDDLMNPSNRVISTGISFGLHSEAELQVERTDTAIHPESI